MAELVLREPCEHGSATGMGHFVPGAKYGTEDWCPGGRETVLDPEQEVFPNWRNDGFRGITVQDVIDALTKEEE